MQPNISFIVSREIQVLTVMETEREEKLVKSRIAQELAREIIDKIKFEKHPGNLPDRVIYKIEIEVKQWLKED